MLVAGVVLGLAAEWVSYGPGDAVKWIPDLVVGWAFIGSGAIATARQPDSRSGRLMTATGFAWFVANFAGVESPVLSWIAANGIYLHRGPLVHLIVAFPSGRLSSRTGRVAAAAGYAAALIPALWDVDLAVFLLSGLLVAVTVREYRKTIGSDRRPRVAAVWAAVGLASVVAGGAAARLALPPGDVTGPGLLIYQVLLAAIAGGLCAALVSRSSQRGEITDIVVELGSADSGTLRAGLSRALGDPSLQIGYAVPGADGFVDPAGNAVLVPDPGSDRSATLVERDGAPVAVIVHDPAVLNDAGLREAVSSAARLAASNARLQVDVQARIADLAGSRRRLLEARDDQRRRLERRLHDGAERRLEELEERLRAARHSASGSPTRERLERANEQLRQTREEVRRLAQGLHPRILAEHGLERALASLTEGFAIPVELNVMTAAIPPTVQSAAYFVCAEGLANVAKYASASNVTITITANDDSVVVAVADNGVGGADAARGSGLRGMADRMAALGGTFSVESAPGQGTRLTAEIPLRGEGS